MLTEQEIKEAVGFTTDQMTAYRRIESAVLEKLKEQEPACFVGRIEDGAMLLMSMPDDWVATPLYEHPLPPDDVVRDAERYHWLMQDDGHNVLMATLASLCATDEPIKHQMDAAIDKAMKEMK